MKYVLSIRLQTIESCHFSNENVIDIYFIYRVDQKKLGSQKVCILL